MAEKMKRYGHIGLQGVVIGGATVGELETIQDLLDGEGTIELSLKAEEVVIRKQGVTKIEMAEVVMGVMDISIEGVDDQPVRKVPSKVHGKRVEDIKTRASAKHCKFRG